MFRILALALVSIAPLASNAAALEENLGAVPAHVAIANAKSEVAADLPTNGMVLWGDADIAPLGHGWCVALHGLHYPDAGAIDIPVFVQQDGRAWRTDAVGKQKYNGGADGLYYPPKGASACRVKASIERDQK